MKAIYKIVPLISAAFFYVNATAENICLKNETIIFSFATKTKKIMSLCKEKDAKYLVYKFGKEDHIELQFPQNLNNNSWKSFQFSGIDRPGGKANAGFGQYSIGFKTGATEYEIFQVWDDEENTYGIGINVSSGGKVTKINGIKKTQEGSLVLLNEESAYISNSMK
jgi:hypothetical protein